MLASPYWGDQTVFVPPNLESSRPQQGARPTASFTSSGGFCQYFGSPDASLNYEIALFESGTPPFEDIYNTINPARTGNDSQLVVGQKFDENCFTMFGCDTTGGGEPAGQLWPGPHGHRGRNANTAATAAVLTVGNGQPISVNDRALWLRSDRH